MTHDVNEQKGYTVPKDIDEALKEFFKDVPKAEHPYEEYFQEERHNPSKGEDTP